jgi:membrane protein implicated in regulation of membrane protease activity
MLIENKYVVIAAALGFLLALFLTGGSLMAAFGILALVAGMGWAVRRFTRARAS